MRNTRLKIKRRNKHRRKEEVFLHTREKHTKRKAKSQKPIGKAQSSCKEKRRNPLSSPAKKRRRKNAQRNEK